MGALLLFTTTVCLCMVNVKTENLEFWQIGVKLCESKCQQRNLCLGIKYEMKYLHCQLLLKKPKEDQTNPEITLRYLNKGQVLNMTACGKGVRILSPPFTEKKCVQDENYGMKIEMVKECVSPDPSCKKLGFQIVQFGSLSSFKELVGNCCDYSVARFIGMNILHWTAACNTVESSAYLKIVRFIVSQKIVPINSQTDSGETALMLAASAGHVDIMEFLVGEHCNVSITNGTGYNVLHMAVEEGRLNVVKYVLENDLIDVKAANVAGKTPLDLARMLRKSKIATLLMAVIQIS